MVRISEETGYTAATRGDVEPYDEVDARMEKLANLLDQRFGLPGIPFRVGLDGIVGLVPGVGDTFTALVGSSILLYGLRMGARKRTLFRMGRNLFVDWLVGLVPLVGDLFDFAYKSHSKNLRLLREERRHLMRNRG